MYNRRRFLILSSGLVAAAALPAKSFGSGPSQGVFSQQSLGAFNQGTMTQSVFEGVQGSVFTAFLSDGSVAYLRLAKIEGLGANASTTSNSSSGKLLPVIVPRGVTSRTQSTQVSGFSLRFSVSGPLTEQGTYLLDHGTLGRMALFLVPGEGSCTAVVISAETASALPVRTVTPSFQVPTITLVSSRIAASLQ
jgi:hypothetical protein